MARLAYSLMAGLFVAGCGAADSSGVHAVHTEAAACSVVDMPVRVCASPIETSHVGVWRHIRGSGLPSSSILVFDGCHVIAEWSPDMPGAAPHAALVPESPNGYYRMRATWSDGELGWTSAYVSEALARDDRQGGLLALERGLRARHGGLNGTFLRVSNIGDLSDLSVRGVCSAVSLDDDL